MAIFPLAPDQTIAQMWSNGARGQNTYGSSIKFEHVLIGGLSKLSAELN